MPFHSEYPRLLDRSENNTLICMLEDGTLHEYFACSDNINAYADMKNIEYIGKGHLHSFNGTRQTIQPDTTHYWKKTTK